MFHLVVVVAVAAAAFGLSAPSGADVTGVKGSACGYYSDVSLFGSPIMPRGCGQVVCTTSGVPPGCVEPADAPFSASPSVTLPPGGSTTPITEHDPDGAKAQYGPAVVFGGIQPGNDPPPSGPLTATTQGTAGPRGSVTSSTSAVLFDPPPTDAPGGVGPGPIQADEVHSTCTADESGVTGSASFVGGILTTKTDSTGAPAKTEPIPDEPEPNYTRDGTVDNVGDTFTVVFNEHILNDDGSLTVNAAHMYLHGPVARGNLVIGQSTCGVTAVTTSTTTSSTTTTRPSTTTSSSSTTSTSTPGGHTCNGLPVTIMGTSGKDVINGTEGPDVIEGLGGDDLIHGLGGDDTICGGGGDDAVYGDAGNDTLLGQNGDDALFGDAGSDELRGGDDGDLLDGGTGRDRLFGAAGNDLILGGAADDLLNGGTGDNVLNGNAGQNTCTAGGGGTVFINCQNHPAAQATAKSATTGAATDLVARFVE